MDLVPGGGSLLALIAVVLFLLRMSSADDTPPKSRRICPWCAAPNASSVRFCDSCGGRLRRA